MTSQPLPHTTTGRLRQDAAKKRREYLWEKVKAYIRTVGLGFSVVGCGGVTLISLLIIGINLLSFHGRIMGRDFHPVESGPPFLLGLVNE